mmetsp:Transcript_30198/g.34671  ORF Transcript_30198/g.34671 Transcript_30198/m.34671 type:complete len:91 (+) Transcript_30198:367-639(+)
MHILVRRPDPLLSSLTVTYAAALLRVIVIMVVVAALLQRDGGRVQGQQSKHQFCTTGEREFERGERPKNALCCDQNNHHLRGKVELLRNN